MSSDFSSLITRAESGDPDAQGELARCYQFGDGVDQNSAMALHWLRRAAEGGYLEAQVTLGILMRVGEQVPRDEPAAVEWFRRAAN